MHNFKRRNSGGRIAGVILTLTVAMTMLPGFPYLDGQTEWRYKPPDGAFGICEFGRIQEPVRQLRYQSWNAGGVTDEKIRRENCANNGL